MDEYDHSLHDSRRGRRLSRRLPLRPREYDRSLPLGEACSDEQS